MATHQSHQLSRSSAIGGGTGELERALRRHLLAHHLLHQRHEAVGVQSTTLELTASGPPRNVREKHACFQTETPTILLIGEAFMVSCHWQNRPEVAAVLLVCCVVAGCGGAASTAPPPAPKMVYVDTATMQPLVHDVATSFPAVHPRTGKPTLRPALYCSTCRQWYPTPSIEDLNRTPGAGLCPKDQTPLTTEGPWPDGSSPAQQAAK